MILQQRLQSITEHLQNGTTKKVPYSIFLCPLCNSNVTKKHNDGINAKTCGSNKCTKLYKEQQNRLKYPTYKMELVEDIGIVPRTTKSGNVKSEHMLIMECPACSTHKQVAITEAVRQASCGKSECIRATRTTTAGNNGSTATHGMSGTKLYHVWQAMVKRCKPENASNPLYVSYAGKGIEVCSNWQTFEGFYTDMGKAYEEFNGSKPSIDRIDPNGNYEPANCEWIEHSVNSVKDQVIPVVQLTLDGEYVATFTSAYEAARAATGVGNKVLAAKVNAVCLGKRKTHAGSLWVTSTNYLSGVYTIPTIKKKAPIIQQSRIAEPVIQLSKDMNVIAEFTNYIEAGRAVGLNSKSYSKVREVCKGKRNSAAGFIWRFKSELETPVEDSSEYLYALWLHTVQKDCSGKWKRYQTFTDDIGIVPSGSKVVKINNNKAWSKSNIKIALETCTRIDNTARKVLQVDRSTKEVLNVFDTTIMAERSTGVTNANIRAVCNGKRKSAGGFGWKYA